MDLNKRFPLYRKLLLLYPQAYREQYGDQMLQTLADMLDDAPSPAQKLSVWTRVSIDMPMSVLKQQLTYTGEVMTHEMPAYIKRNAVISALLLVPFLTALIANGADKIIRNNTLYHSWLWRMPVLGIWVLYLPLIATAITFASLVTLLVQRKRTQQSGWLRTLLDLRRNWPVLAVLFAGTCIVTLVQLHDTTQCVVGNPVRETRQWHQTWHCVQQNQGITTTLRKLDIRK